MRFTVSSQALTEGLTWVARSLPSRPAIPVLAGVKMDVIDGRLALSTFDYEQSAVAFLDLDSDAEDGTVIVPGKMFSDIARNVPKGNVEVFVEGARVRVLGGKAKFALPVMPTEEYPALPDLPATFGSIPADIFGDAIRQVAVAAGKDDAVPFLTGVYVQTDPETGVLTFAATDRYRLAVKQIEYTPAPGTAEQSFLVPARSMDGYAKALSGTGDVAFGGSKTNGAAFSVSTDLRAATTRLLEGDFPQFNKLLPTEFTSTATVNTKDLLDAVKRVSLVADSTTPCRLRFDVDGVTVEAGPLADPDGSEPIEDIVFTGDEPITIAFNFDFLTTGLSAVGSEKVVISMVAPLKPAVLRPAVEENQSPDYTYLIMPVRVNG